MKSTKFWLVLIGAVLAVSAVLSALLFWGGRGRSRAVVIQDGAVLRTIDLDRVDEPFSFTVAWEGGFNVVEVEKGRVRVVEADCPDRVCVRQGWLSGGAAPIACLPHKLVIRLEGGASGPDAAAG